MDNFWNVKLTDHEKEVLRDGVKAEFWGVLKKVLGITKESFYCMYNTAKAENDFIKIQARIETLNSIVAAVETLAVANQKE